jgi:hypothetical protein
MSNLVEHAKTELKAAGLFDKDSDYDGMLGEAALELVEVFDKQGHSGLSAPYVADIVNKLFMFKPLLPLTGEDSEWTCLDYDSEVAYQNKRYSSVFKDKDGQAYDIEGRIFIDPDGHSYTNKDSRVYITFPYTPTREFVEEPKK